MSAEHAPTEIPAEGDLSPRFGGAVELVEAVNAATSRKSEIVAFKFGGTSLLGAKRMTCKQPSNRGLRYFERPFEGAD